MIDDLLIKIQIHTIKSFLIFLMQYGLQNQVRLSLIFLRKCFWLFSDYCGNHRFLDSANSDRSKGDWFYLGLLFDRFQGDFLDSLGLLLLWQDYRFLWEFDLRFGKSLHRYFLEGLGLNLCYFLNLDGIFHKFFLLLYWGDLHS